jgi:L-rhamnose isomerase
MRVILGKKLVFAPPFAVAGRYRDYNINLGIDALKQKTRNPVQNILNIARTIRKLDRSPVFSYRKIIIQKKAKNQQQNIMETSGCLSAPGGVLLVPATIH